MLSLLTFLATHILIYMNKFKSIYNVILAMWALTFVTDIMPIWYVIYCHRRSFKRMLFDYEVAEKRS